MEIHDFFPFVIFLTIIAVSTAVVADNVQITIEYNVTSTCTGTIALALNPSTVLKSGSVTPSASGLSNCDAKIVYFRNVSCAGTQVSSCSVSGTGCSGSAFTAPTSTGSYPYYACFDKNDDADFSDAGESDTKTLVVDTSVPTVGALTMSVPDLDLIAGTKRFEEVTATITNTDGAGSISSCYGYLFNSSIAAPYTAAKATYTNLTCSLSGCAGTTCTCKCGFYLWYYDTSGTWRGNVTANTTAGKVGVNQGTFIVENLTAVDVQNIFGPINTSNPYPIAFSNLNVGDINRPSSSNPMKIINSGNTKLKTSISGSDHVGVNDSSWVIKVGNMTYNSSATGMTTLNALTNASTDFYPAAGIPAYPVSVSGISEKGTFYIYNYLSIPNGFKAQGYRSTYYLTSSAV